MESVGKSVRQKAGADYHSTAYGVMDEKTIRLTRPTNVGLGQRVPPQPTLSLLDQSLSSALGNRGKSRGERWLGVWP